MPLRNWYNCGTQHFHQTSVVSRKWKIQLDWVIKPVTHDLVRRIRFVENKNLWNMILNICTGRSVKYFSEICLTVREHKWLVGLGGNAVFHTWLSHVKGAYEHLIGLQIGVWQKNEINMSCHIWMSHVRDVFKHWTDRKTSCHIWTFGSCHV